MYPFGTEMIIHGYKSGKAVKVLDRGGVIRGNRLDVFFDSHQEALKWGVRHLDVKIRYQ
jgi:3D (Asp-Asp-Asp) domain-containing protein